MTIYHLLRKNIALLAVLLCTACSQSPQNNGTNATSGDTTRLEYQLKIINDKINADPKNAVLFAERAKINAARDVFPASIADYEQAIRLDSMNQSYYLMLADVAFRSLQVRKSVEAFKKCLSIDPSNREANLKFAELNLYLKAYPDAIKYANEALKSDERQVKPYFIKGFVYKEMKDTARAISSFQTVVELDPEYYDAYIQLGNIFSQRGNPLALQYFANALRVRPTSTEALYNRGLFFQNNGKLEAAISDYQTILSIDPNYSDAHYNLGYIELVLRNQPTPAIGHFSAAIRCNPDYVEAYYNRGMAFNQMGNREAAKRDFLKTLSIYPAYKLAQERLKEMGVE